MTIQLGLQVRVEFQPDFYFAVEAVVGIFRKAIRALMWC